MGFIPVFLYVEVLVLKYVQPWYNNNVEIGGRIDFVKVFFLCRTNNKNEEYLLLKNVLMRFYEPICFLPCKKAFLSWSLSLDTGLAVRCTNIHKITLRENY